MNQEWIVLGIVVAAAAFLGRVGYRVLFGGGGCGSSCGGCAKPVVEAEQASPKRIALPQV